MSLWNSWCRRGRKVSWTKGMCSRWLWKVKLLFDLSVSAQNLAVVPEWRLGTCLCSTENVWFLDLQDWAAHSRLGVEPCNSHSATCLFTHFQLNCFRSTHMSRIPYFFTELPCTLDSTLLGAGATFTCAGATDCPLSRIWITLECCSGIQVPCRKGLPQCVCSANL